MANPVTAETAGDDLPIDFDHLQRFTMGNRSLEREVLGLFRSQSHSCIDRLKAAAEDKDWREAAHTLKGAAAGIGAWEVYEVSGHAEKLTGVQRASEAVAAIGMLEAAVGRTDSMIAQFLNE